MTTVVFFDSLSHFYDRHGIYSLSSVLKQNGIEVHFVRGPRQAKALQTIRSLAPDLLLYSAFSFAVPSFREFDKIAKQTLKANSLIGGPGPTFDWDCIKDSTIDAFCAGEGEIALLDYIQSGFRSRKNIAPKGSPGPSEFHPFAELDRLPFPDRDIVYRVDPTLRNMPSKQFLSGRGCPYDCTYCFNHKFREIFKTCGSVIRKKSVGYLLDEIRLVRGKYPLLTVVFNDDTFIIDKKWFLNFANVSRKKSDSPTPAISGPIWSTRKSPGPCATADALS
ncbi:MAG TPA: cobalamin-dependent protein [Candidatus Omnitrophota bacterium]|nr:cobalamin-dependent protein [Candidatus Omnitrophota bacterium]